jgi:hypothetical protein
MYRSALNREKKYESEESCEEQMKAQEIAIFATMTMLWTVVGLTQLILGLPYYIW